MLNDIEIAKKIINGDLPPIVYREGSFTFFDMRISGTGLAYREAGYKRMIYRDPNKFLTKKLLDLCNGLPIIFNHNKINQAAIIGNVFYPYINYTSKEIRAIVKIYDKQIANYLANSLQSTSCDFVCKTTKIHGLNLEIDEPPITCDHLAILPNGIGVWDKFSPILLSTAIKRKATMPDEIIKEAAENPPAINSEIKKPDDSNVLNEILSLCKKFDDKFIQIDSEITGMKEKINSVSDKTSAIDLINSKLAETEKSIEDVLSSSKTEIIDNDSAEKADLDGHLQDSMRSLGVSLPRFGSQTPLKTMRIISAKRMAEALDSKGISHEFITIAKEDDFKTLPDSMIKMSLTQLFTLAKGYRPPAPKDGLHKIKTHEGGAEVTRYEGSIAAQLGAIGARPY
jgi:hypothetical protein